VQRASTTCSIGSEDIGTVDIAIAKDVSTLCLQLVTKAQAKMAAKELVPGKELLEPLLDLIAKHQEQNLYYKQITRQALYPY
jgi:peptide subunit release factor 1 (eRF1)